MQRLLLSIDRISAWVGKTFAWCILLLTLAISYEVFMRYVFRAPTFWVYDASYMLYGALFMMAGAYTLSRNGHVRGDFLYRKWPPRVQASVDLTMYILFFFACMAALIYSGWNFFKPSYQFNEHSSFTPDGPPIWPFKALIPIAGLLLFLQGLAESVRCVICIRTGDWPRRLHDVEELEQVVLAQAALARENKTVGGSTAP
ncbi:TRAP transporter small permease subunit [Azospirillum sp. SYSU D00513]|uniref:TRAP transporter small permease subunit n=2 Tax=Pseudomonadati TaxID=3379134 RepID=UPI001A958884|nr:TRAP transporter small permease subunit [Azospirillum sp. SYSU D00513]